MTRQLTFPAPNRESIPAPQGGWVTRPWTVSGVLKACAGGAKFHQGLHDMEPGTWTFAKDAMELFNHPLSKEA